MEIKKLINEIEKRSILKHPFYQLWTEGRLDSNAIKEYIKEYFQIVKVIPKILEKILNYDVKNKEEILRSYKEEIEHIDLWKKFAKSFNLNEKEIENFKLKETKDLINKFEEKAKSSLEEGAAALFAFEYELPKISKIKEESLINFYNINEKYLKYFKEHQKVDIRHANVWKRILKEMEEEKFEKAYNSLKEILYLKNKFLDSLYNKYVKN